MAKRKPTSSKQVLAGFRGSKSFTTLHSEEGQTKRKVPQVTGERQFDVFTETSERFSRQQDEEPMLCWMFSMGAGYLKTDIILAKSHCLFLLIRIKFMK